MPMTQININVNNQPMSVISPISLSELIALEQLKDEGTAVAKNAAIISKNEWPTTYLSNNDTVDIFTLVAGG
jgi:sulfur carrier protein